MNLTSLFIAVLICAPAVALASQRSSWLIDYLIAVVAFNRGIRRIVDYSNGAFDPLSPISLTPLVVGGLAALVVMNELQRGGRSTGAITKRVLRWYLIACGIGFVVGLYYNRLGAVYALGGYLGPVGMLGFAARYATSPKTLKRWATTAAVIGIGVAAYGLYQFYTIPPWDAFWVRAVKFEGYLGYLEPTKMTLFSTTSSRGPAAMLLGGALIIILLRPKLLGALRFPAAALVGYAMLLTYSRTSVIYVGLACGALPITTKGKGLGQLAVLAVALAFFGEQMLGFLPGQEKIVSRYSTLGNIQDDGSFQGRIMLLGIAVQKIVTNPIGYGMGSGGLAGRVSGTTQQGVADSTGYLQILTTFGVVGAGYIFMILRQLWLSSTFVWRSDPKDPDVALFRAWFVSGMVVLFSGNWLAGVSFFWVLAGCVLGKHDGLVEAAAASRFMEPPPNALPGPSAAPVQA